MNNVTRDALALSSGTIAGLIDNSLYSVCDKVQQEFVQFCLENEGKFDTWVTAWHAFEEVRQESTTDFLTVAGEGAPQYTFLASTETQLTLKL